MSELQKATQDAVEAARQGDTYAIALAAFHAAQQARQDTPAAPAPAAPVKAQGSAMRWLAVGISGSALLLSVAVSAVAVAISAVALTVCLLILRSVLQDLRKDR